ncbi:16S rRNA (guanine(527)-N(7))-methyltransferase RsmG [Thalassorhabdomicrobium marinisediminis]|uniref:16S rRNA (guanine(527)-N(7))-methyltransferase RsmG n=1 Tax=Thalassorhabdomicrobium marinisediminis TaxID=2170577 RepID=UPI00249075AB|nr:16S rRNA (guanine(527)-N(7))-methyltransferase RsmG [Thalassorhabdomicrobium marinisediminis]
MTSKHNHKHVSRETNEQLVHFSTLLSRWTKTINLVSNSSTGDIWSRHIADSAQLFHLAPQNWRRWTDIGSGGGLPGVVIAILDERRRPLTLIESDKRKCQFLRTAKRELGLNYQVVNDRIETSEIVKADVVSARALAPLPKLLNLAKPLLEEGGISLFPKGKTFQSEIDAAKNDWSFDYKLHPSITSSEAKILELARILRREP